MATASSRPTRASYLPVVLLVAALALRASAAKAPPGDVRAVCRAPGARAENLRGLVRAAVAADASLAAVLLRLVFHDCYSVNAGRGGCNGSVRLELARRENSGLQPGVDALRPMQHRTGLSWGDTVVVAAAEAVAAAGGPRIPVCLGRSTAAAGDPEGIIPSGGASLAELRTSFAPRGFSDEDLVALSGAHTLGAARGRPFVRENTKFQNDYFVNLKWFIDQEAQGKPTDGGPPDIPNAQLPSDRALIADAKVGAIVVRFARSKHQFFKAFVKAFVKLADLGFQDTPVGGGGGGVPSCCSQGAPYPRLLAAY